MKYTEEIALSQNKLYVLFNPFAIVQESENYRPLLINTTQDLFTEIKAVSNKDYIRNNL